MLKGIDISHHQNGIDIGVTGIDFVIVKATEGNGYTDPSCDKLYQEAKSCGKKLGVYHFARPDLGNSAETEADWFISQIQGYIKEAMLVLDWEQKALNYPVSWAKAWLDRVYSKTGVKPVIYMSASPMRSCDWSSVANADYGLWVANYGANDGQPHEEAFNKYPLKHWKFYALWQYTSTGRVNGYSGNIDVDYFNGDGTAWDKYAGGIPNVTPSQPTPSKPVQNTITYVVKKGDTLSKIASKYGTTYQELARINGISNPDKIYTGQVLTINGNVTSSSNVITYIVKKGDTLSGIASKYGTTYQKIAKNNGISDPNKIYPGQVLKI